MNDRILKDSDIRKYDAMVESYMRDYVVKNWNEASISRERDHVPLGNTGFTMEDFRQQLRAEVCVALMKFNPNYRTKEGRSVKESTFVYRHLFNRIGQLMKKLTKKRHGYGIWHNNLEEVLWETNREK